MTKTSRQIDSGKAVPARQSNQDEARRIILVAAGLAVGTALIFSGVCGHQFLNYDDQMYVTDNPRVRDGLTLGGLGWAFSSFYASNWHPLTWLSLQMDAQVFGMRPWGFHLTNLLLHTCNSVLLFLILTRMTGAVWRSAVVVALFSLHPLHVESVAWVTERKDVLSTLFWVLTIGAYHRYTQAPVWSNYISVIALFGLGALSKPMVVTLPCVLLLLDYWPLNRLAPPSDDGRWPTPVWPLVRSRLLEKFPLFVISAACSTATSLAQEQAKVSVAVLPFSTRLGNALTSYVSYLRKTIWPVDLAAHYPHPSVGLDVVTVLCAALLMLAVTGLIIRYRDRAPYLLVGWFWYLGTLVPVIGLVQVGTQGMADRYTYVPLIGVFLAAVWGIAEFFQRCSIKARIVGLLTWGMLLTCAAYTWNQVQVWHSDETLWEHALLVTERNVVAHKNLAAAYIKSGLIVDAIRQYEAALAIDPLDSETLNNLGCALAMIGDLERHRLISVRHCASIPPTQMRKPILIGLSSKWDRKYNSLSCRISTRSSHSGCSTLTNASPIRIRHARVPPRVFPLPVPSAAAKPHTSRLHRAAENQWAVSPPAQPTTIHR